MALRANGHDLTALRAFTAEYPNGFDIGEGYVWDGSQFQKVFTQADSHVTRFFFTDGNYNLYESLDYGATWVLRQEHISAICGLSYNSADKLYYVHRMDKKVYAYSDTATLEAGSQEWVATMSRVVATRAVCNNGLFVCSDAADSYKLKYSTRGITWYDVDWTGGAPTTYWQGQICYSDGLWLCANANSYIGFSHDGIHWGYLATTYSPTYGKPVDVGDYLALGTTSRYPGKVIKVPKNIDISSPSVEYLSASVSSQYIPKISASPNYTLFACSDNYFMRGNSTLTYFTGAYRAGSNPTCDWSWSLWSEELSRHIIVNNDDKKLWLIDESGANWYPGSNYVQSTGAVMATGIIDRVHILRI